MGWKLLLLSGLLTAAAQAGLCTTELSPSGLPKASCHFPSCPEGNDCQPPSIEKGSASIEYHEPLIKWEDSCSDKAITPTGACWEVYVDFKLKLGATDPSGVASIGVHLSQEVSAKRIFKKYFGKVTGQTGHGGYLMEATLVTHVPPGQRLDIDVYELCARDGVGNEGCILPGKGKALSFRP